MAALSMTCDDGCGNGNGDDMDGVLERIWHLLSQYGHAPCLICMAFVKRLECLRSHGEKKKLIRKVNSTFRHQMIHERQKQITSHVLFRLEIIL